MENKNIREKYEEEIYRLIYDTESMDACKREKAIDDKNNFKRRRNIEFVAKRKYIFALTVFPVSHNPSPIFIVNC